MPLSIQEVTDRYTKQTICESILTQLPDWFENKKAVRSYVKGVVGSVFLAAYDGDILRGFISLKQTSQVTSEVYVMAVSPDYHGEGTGKFLLKSAQSLLLDKKVKYLILKTLSDRSDDMFYARTRAFYKSIGFEPLEELSTFWDEDNPCLNMIWVL